jgi:hypothetical protein
LKRQQRWDLSFWDVNFEVRWTLIGYHPDGKLVASQPVKVGDELVATNFVNSITMTLLQSENPTWLSAYFRAR